MERKIELTSTEKELVKLTQHLTLKDWNNFRTEEYWEIRDSLSNKFERDLYLLKVVKNYLS